MRGWSRFDESRNLDFNSVLWVRPGGSLVIDPLPLSEHDRSELMATGPVALIVVTNSEHLRDARDLSQRTGAKIAGPRQERERLQGQCDLWLGDQDSPLPGVRTLEMRGSKTKGELALVLDETTLVTGDLVRAPVGGELAILPDAKLEDVAEARESVRRLLSLQKLDAILVGDGWPVFREGRRALEQLVASWGN